MGMADHIKRGETVFFPFKNGETCTDSQHKPRMYKTVQAFDRHFYHSKDGVELVEYAEVVRCKDCKHWEQDGCPMYREELIEWEEDGYRESELVVYNLAHDNGFCDSGEREDNDI